MTDLDVTTVKHDASDARVATTAGRNLAELIDAERGKGAAADRVWLRAAEASQAEWGSKARNANAALIRGIAGAPGAAPAAQSWGQRFTSSPQWRNRTGLTCNPVELGGYLDLEERATAGPLAPGTPAGGLGPIASRCGIIPAQPVHVALLRWQGPLLPGAPQVPEELKQAAGDAPELQVVVAPYIGAWLPVTRQLLDDHAVLAGLIDDRLRRGLALSLDNELVDMAASDADVPAAASVLAAVGELSAAGYGGDLTAIVAGADFATIGPVADLTALGVGAVLASSVVPPGTAIVGNLGAGIQIRTVGAARVMVTDSHADTFLSNRLVILAEQRVAWGCADPWALRLVGADGTGATRTAGKRAA